MVETLHGRPRSTELLARLGLIGLLLSTLLIAACGSPSGLPSAPGQYPIKERSVSFDGERYSFYWADAAGNLHRAFTRDVKLQLDDRNLLEVGANRQAILHLTQQEPIVVEGRDRQGDFGSFWYPFLVGSMLSRGGGPVIINQAPPREYREPVYRYPPTDRFDRGDTIGGSVVSPNARPPDYSRLPPVGGTVSGQSGGTGGGNAATNRAAGPVASSGQSAGSGAGDAATNRAAIPPAVSGQSGGTGSGSAAISKSGSFRRGDQGYDAKVDAGTQRTTTGSGASSPRIGAGSGALGDKPSISTGRGSAPAPSVSRPPSGGSIPRITTGRSSAPSSRISPPRSSGSVPRISTGRRR